MPRAGHKVSSWPVDQQIQVSHRDQIVLLCLVHHVSLCLPTKSNSTPSRVTTCLATHKKITSRFSNKTETVSLLKHIEFAWINSRSVFIRRTSTTALCASIFSTISCLWHVPLPPSYVHRFIFAVGPIWDTLSSIFNGFLYQY